MGRIGQAAATPRSLSNDLLPPLELAHIPLGDLMPARQIRKLDPAHVREIAEAVQSLGLCAPILIGKDNLVPEDSLACFPEPIDREAQNPPIVFTQMLDPYARQMVNAQ